MACNAPQICYVIGVKHEGESVSEYKDIGGSKYLHVIFRKLISERERLSVMSKNLTSIGQHLLQLSPKQKRPILQSSTSVMASASSTSTTHLASLSRSGLNPILNFPPSSPIT